MVWTRIQSGLGFGPIECGNRDDCGDAHHVVDAYCRSRKIFITEMLGIEAFGTNQWKLNTRKHVLNKNNTSFPSIL